MDGSVSSLSSNFAAAYATRSSHTASLIGLATSVGAGISMAFAEALSDDGNMSDRGNPWVRGGVCRLVTFLGAFGHTIPFLTPDFIRALWIAIVAVELVLISWVRHCSAQSFN